MKPLVRFETDHTIKQEKLVAKFYGDYTNLTPIKIKRYYSLDGALVGKDNKPLEYIEIKCLSKSYSGSDEYFISSNKVWKALDITRLQKIPCMLVVRWTDAIGCINFERLHDVSDHRIYVMSDKKKRERKEQYKGAKGLLETPDEPCHYCSANQFSILTDKNFTVEKLEGMYGAN